MGYLAKEGISSYFLNEMSQQQHSLRSYGDGDGRSQASYLEMIK